MQPPELAHPSTPLAMLVPPVPPTGAAGADGAEMFLNGSSTIDEGEIYVPVVPRETEPGFDVEPPRTPKFAPVPVVQYPGSAVPAFDRSMIPPAFGDA